MLADTGWNRRYLWKESGEEREYGEWWVVYYEAHYCCDGTVSWRASLEQ